MKTRLQLCMSHEKGKVVSLHTMEELGGEQV